MSVKRKTSGLFLGAIGIGVLLASIMPMGFLVVLGGIIFLLTGCSLLRNG